MNEIIVTLVYKLHNIYKNCVHGNTNNIYKNFTNNIYENSILWIFLQHNLHWYLREMGTMNISIYENFGLWLTIKINKDDRNYHIEGREIQEFKVMVFWCYSNEESNKLLSNYTNLNQ